jgi:hypothetical protein
MTRAKDISKIVTDADLSGTLDVTGDLNVDTNTLKVDSSNNRVGIGGTPTAYPFEVFGGNGDGLVFKETTNSVTNWFGALTSVGTIGTLTDHPLAFYSNASERMRIDSNGRTGIGITSNFRGFLNVFNGDDFNTVSNGNCDNIYLVSDATSGDNVYGASIAFSRVQYPDRRGAAIASVQTGSDEDNVGLAFFTHPSTTAGDPIVEAMRIDSSGNVGIGTTSPESTLDVLIGNNNGARFRYSAASTFLQIKPEPANGNVSLRFRANSGSAPDLLLNNDGGTEIARFGDNGKVGIGTSSPSEKLEINSGTGNIGAKIVSTDSLAVIAFKDNSTTDVQYLGANGNNLVFHAGATPSERMRIDSNGNVGIGNTASGFNAQADNLVVGTGSGANGITIYSGSDSTGDIFFADGTGDSDETRGGINYNHTNNYMNFRVNDAPKMYILSNGRVGIGTSSPDNLLHIKTTGSTPSIELEQDAGTSYKGLIKLAGNDLEIRGSSGSLEFYNGSQDGDSSAERMSINASGAITFSQNSSSVTQRYNNAGYAPYYIFRFAMTMAGNTAYTIAVNGFGNGTYKYDMFGSHWSSGYHAYRNSYIASQSSGLHTEFNLHNASSTAHGAFSVSYSGTSGRINFIKSAGTYIGEGITILEIIGRSNLTIHSIS